MQEQDLHTTEATALALGTGSWTVCSGDGQTGMMRAGGMVLPPLKWCFFPVSFAGTCVDTALQLYLCAAQSCTDAAILLHYKHTALAFLTCFIFASHLPERLAPGHFDYIGKGRQAQLALLPPDFQEEKA